MKRRGQIVIYLALIAVTALVALAWGARPEEVRGVRSEQASVLARGSKALTARIWYPEHAQGGEKRPLIVISHGTGGSSSGHSDTAGALAAAGFVVIAIEHTGDNFRDISNVGRGTHLIERPRHVSRAIDYMLGQWAHRAAIDPDRIGMLGHSAGGFTALVIAGANPDLGRRVAHCRKRPQAWDCHYLRRNGYKPENLGSQREVSWHHDPRVKAIAIAAPPLGYSFDAANMADVKLPVQLWAAGRDDIVDESPDLIRRALPVSPDFHGLPNAGHFSFLMPCNVSMRAVITVMQWFGTDAVCTDPAGFDRKLFHRQFNTAVTAFFRSTLGAVQH